MLKRIFRSRAVQTLFGHILASYLRLIVRTGRRVFEPADILGHAVPHAPLIIAMWHGQHFLLPAVRPKDFPLAGIVSRSGDGEVNAVALKAFGIGAIRASGGQAAHHYKKRGGAKGFLQALKSLRDGVSVALTADVPKGPARICGAGIIQLARRSQCPILPAAIATRRHFSLNTWDKATINLPFGRVVLVLGTPIYVSEEGSDEVMEADRRRVEQAMNDTTARAYHLAAGGK